MEIKRNEIKRRLVRNFTIFLITTSDCNYITLGTNAELTSAIMLAIEPIFLTEGVGPIKAPLLLKVECFKALILLSDLKDRGGVLKATDAQRRGEVLKAQFNRFGVCLGQVIGKTLPTAATPLSLTFQSLHRCKPRSVIIDLLDHFKVIDLCNLHQLIKALFSLFEGENV